VTIPGGESHESARRKVERLLLKIEERERKRASGCISREKGRRRETRARGEERMMRAITGTCQHRAPAGGSEKEGKKGSLPLRQEGRHRRSGKASLKPLKLRRVFRLQMAARTIIKEKSLPRSKKATGNMSPTTGEEEKRVFGAGAVNPPRETRPVKKGGGEGREKRALSLLPPRRGSYRLEKLVAH